MTTLDRMLFFSYLRSYTIVLVCVLSLYVIVDLFTNLDDFTGHGFATMVEHVFYYYSTRISQIFDRLSEAITLLGAMFSVAWMQRSNELMPQLAAGISTRRVLRPILLGACLTLTLGPINQEFIIPRIADFLTTDKDDPDQKKPTQVRGTYDKNGLHVEGVAAFRNEKKVYWFFATFSENSPTGMMHLSAKEARYIAPDPENPERTGGWMTYNTTTTPPLGDGPMPPGLTMVSPGQFFLKSAVIDFDAVTRGANWHLFSSTPELRRVLARPDERRQPAVAVTFHMRLTRPLIGALLVLLGLSIILRDQNRNVFISAGMCLIMCGVFFMAVYGCKFLGEGDILTPPLAAWLPVMIFGPLSISLFDAIHT